MENWTPNLGSKLSIAFISPTHPTWNTSSLLDFLWMYFWITDKTSRMFANMNSERAAVSPNFMRDNISNCSLLAILGMVDVSTPAISTFDIWLYFWQILIEICVLTKG